MLNSYVIYVHMAHLIILNLVHVQGSLREAREV